MELWIFVGVFILALILGIYFIWNEYFHLIKKETSLIPAILIFLMFLFNHILLNRGGFTKPNGYNNSDIIKEFVLLWFMCAGGLLIIFFVYKMAGL